MNFAEAIKHGISSYSPLKTLQSAKHGNEEDTKGLKKTIKFGPPNISLNDNELDEVIEQNKYRAQTANSLAISSIGTGSSWFSGKNSHARGFPNKMSFSLNQTLAASRDTRVLDSYENYQKHWQH